MRRALALAAIVSTLPFAGAAQSRFSAPPAQAPQSAQPIRFANMDRNGDGVITRGEWRGTAQAFNDADWNRDGVLSGNEVRPVADARRGGNGQAARERAARFRTLDADNDGVVSRWEWPDTWQSFTNLDRNRDDVLTSAEAAGSTAFPADDAAIGTAGTGTRRGVATSGNIVRVDPKERWTDTGLDVVVGDRLYFDAEGSIQMSEGGPDVSTPAGAASGRQAASAPLPRAVAGILIARIGASAPLLIGAQRTLARAPVSGRLYLGVNDDHLADNSGEYRVSVTVERR